MATCRICSVPVETLQQSNIRCFKNEFCSCPTDDKVLCLLCILNMVENTSDQCPKCESYLMNIYVHRRPVSLEQFRQWIASKINTMVHSKSFQVVSKIIICLNLFYIPLVYWLNLRPTDQFPREKVDYLYALALVICLGISPGILLGLSLAALFWSTQSLLIHRAYRLFMSLRPRFGPQGRLVRVNIVEPSKETMLILGP